MQNTLNRSFLTLAMASVLATSQAQAAIISFDDYAADNGTEFTSYSEAGYTVEYVSGTVLAAQIFGNPVPALYGTDSGTIAVTYTGGGSFTFNAVDFAANNGDAGYSIEGLLGGSSVFSYSDTVAQPLTYSFETVLSQYAALIDTLYITVDPEGTSYNIDNINVSVIPVPAAAWLLGSGALALLATARRRKA